MWVKVASGPKNATFIWASMPRQADKTSRKTARIDLAGKGPALASDICRYTARSRLATYTGLPVRFF